MLHSTSMILDTLADYSSPRCRLQRLVDRGDYIQLKRGLYEDDPDVPGFALASSIYGPSYLSFEYAMAYHGLIPERVFVYTSATSGKHRTKMYTNSFGSYMYRDVPPEVYAYGQTLQRIGAYDVWMATPEKSLCDKLYTLKPLRSIRDMSVMLFDDLRIDDDELMKMDVGAIVEISQHYHSRNVGLFCQFMKEALD